VEKINMRCLFFIKYDMNKFGIFVICLIVFSWIMAWCSGNKSNDMKNLEADEILVYNDSMREFWLKCFESDQSMRDVYNSYKWWSTDDIKKAIDDTVSECKNSMFQINDLWDIEWDTSLKDGAILLIQKMIERYEKLYEVLPFLPLLSEGLEDEDYTIYENIKEDLDSLGAEIKDLNKSLRDIQNWFAENHWYAVVQ